MNIKFNDLAVWVVITLWPISLNILVILYLCLGKYSREYLIGENIDT